jgi:hypothetical protein
MKNQPTKKTHTMKTNTPKPDDQATAPLSFTTEEAREILAEGKSYCVAAGIKKPTAKDIHRAIAYEHGLAFATAVCKHNVYLGIGVRRFHESLYEANVENVASGKVKAPDWTKMIKPGGLFGGPSK